MPPKRSRLLDVLDDPTLNPYAGPSTPSAPPRKRQRNDASVAAPGPSASSAASARYPGASKKSSAPDVNVRDGPRRKGKAKDKEAEPQEKRLARHKPSCPKNILERVDRVIQQRFFMIDRKRNGDELKEEFNVLGSTGNVYTVIIDKTPGCNCPDAVKGNHCKHILFIFLKVLQVTQASGYWYQKALLTSELRDIFEHAPRAPAALANDRVLTAYARATGRSEPAAQVDAGKRRMPTEEDDCPVCYDKMHGAGVAALVWCAGCGNALHKECFQNWARAQAGRVTCVYCRAPWVDTSAAASSSGGTRRSEGYINLGSVAGLSPVRDTSTYYHGPTRGKRHYGYREYDIY